MNEVMISRILELSEKKDAFYKIRKVVKSWKGIIIISILVMTSKIAIEQIVMAIR